MTTDLYYTAPTDAIFEEVRHAAISLWYSVRKDPDYVQEKVRAIKDISNVKDNVMYIVAMFDYNNQELLGRRLSGYACTAIHKRMIDGGTPNYLIPF